MASLLKQLAVLVIVAAAGAWAATMYFAPAEESGGAGGPRRGGPTPVVVAETREGTVERAVSAVGSGRALRSVELRVEEDGRVRELLFEPGDLVRAGAPLVRLDDARERADLAEAEAELAEAEAAFERAAALQEQGRITDSAYDSAEAARARAAARADRARLAVERRVLYAPFDGAVGFTDVEEGAYVTRSEVIAVLDDLAFLDADFTVPERHFGEVEIGDAVRAVTRAFPDEVFEGEVVAVDRRVDEVSRAFRVRARIANPGFRLPAGLFLQVELVLDRREAVLAPEEALVMEGGGASVFVVGEGDVVERREVRVGTRRAGEAEILEGLAPGERVVTRGVQKVRPGAEVAPRPEEGASAEGVAAAGARAPS